MGSPPPIDDVVRLTSSSDMATGAALLGCDVGGLAVLWNFRRTTRAGKYRRTPK